MHLELHFHVTLNCMTVGTGLVIRLSKIDLTKSAPTVGSLLISLLNVRPLFGSIFRRFNFEYPFPIASDERNEQCSRQRAKTNRLKGLPRMGTLLPSGSVNYICIYVDVRFCLSARSVTLAFSLSKIFRQPNSSTNLSWSALFTISPDCMTLQIVDGN